MVKSSTQPDKEIAMNRKSWEHAIQHHNLAKGDIARIILSAEGALFPEIREFFHDVKGKRIVQLFCNDGHELLSIIKDGATGVGIDFSTNAIRVANNTNLELKFDCTFLCQEVLTWLHSQAPGAADIFFTSLGSLWWLPNIRDYFSSTYRAIAPGGNYILWDFHPLVHILDDQLRIRFPYPFPLIKRFHESGIIDYVTNPDQYYLPARKPIPSDQFTNNFPVHDYLWGIAEIIEAISIAGWRIESMVEYPHILGERYLNGLVRVNEYKFTTREGEPNLPLTFAMVLRKS